MTDEVEDALPPAPTRNLSYANLDDVDFEELVYDLLVHLGFVNVDWRKGTPKKASPSDRGRDIVAQWVVTDVDGRQRFETWFVDAKHYKTGIPPEALQGLATWSESERPDVALVAASGFLSNAAKDWVESYQKNRAPAFRFKYWEKPDFARFLARFPELRQRHGVIEADSVRTTSEILAVETEAFDKVWYSRSVGAGHEDDELMSEQLRATILDARRKVEERYGIENLGPYDDWSWGYLSGKLATLRWVLGDEPDNLDS